MSMWSVPEADGPAGSPVTTGTPTVPTTTLGHVRIPATQWHRLHDVFLHDL